MARICFFLIALIPCLLLGQSTPQEAKLYGYLLEYPSQKPLSNIRVSAIGANGRPSNSDGLFVLAFRGKTPGDKVNLTINQLTYQIARYQHPVPVFLRKNADSEPITIELCLEGKCPADELYREIKRELQRQVRSINEEISLLPANSDKVAALEDSLTRLIILIQEQEATIRDLTQQIARSDFGDASPLEEQAVAYLKRGLIDSAIYVLEAGGVKEMVRDLTREEAKAQQDLEEIQAQKAESLKSLITLARSYALDYRKDSAVSAYQQAIAADTSDYELRYEYAQYLKDIKRYQPALRELASLLDAPLEPWQIGNLYGFRSELYQEIGQLPEAMVEIRRLVARYEQLAQDDSVPTFYQQNLAVSYEKLGGIYQAQGQLDSALHYFAIRSRLGEELYAANPQSVDMYGGLGISYVKLGGVHEAQGQLDSTLAYYQKALEIFATLYQQTEIPRWGQYGVIMLQAVERIQETLLTPAEKVARAQQQIAELQAQGASDTDLASAHGSLSWYLLFDQRPAEAEAAAREAIRLDPSGAEWVHTNLALALLLQDQYEAAEAIYRRYAGKPYDAERGWTEVFLDDLAALREAGITHPDMAKVEDMLRE